MKDVREDDVFWKFLDPHASWVFFFDHSLSNRKYLLTV